MSGREMEEFVLLKQKVYDVLERYNKLEEELGEARAKNLELAGLLQGNETELEEVTNSYNRVKLSAAITGDEEGSLMAKKRINNLVREIDNCIALLNNI